MFDTVIQAELGELRARLFQRYAARIRSLADDVPETTLGITHIPVQLEARNAAESMKEFGEYLERFGREKWYVVTGPTDSGRYRGMASEHQPKGALGSHEWMTQLLFTDLHTRLSAWLAIQIWRAEELSNATYQALSSWHIIAAAACSRALLESAAATNDVASNIERDWDEFKRVGVPSTDSISRFSNELSQMLVRMIMSSRIGQSSGEAPKIPAKNVVTYLKRFAKTIIDYDVLKIYDWLCDAVHGSFGSNTTFTVTNAVHATKTRMHSVYARRPLEHELYAAWHVTPDVAHSVADGMIVALRSMLTDFARIKWIVDDLGITSKVAFNASYEYFGQMSQPSPNDRCPCGSGIKYKRCAHEWGKAGLALPAIVNRLQPSESGSAL